MIHIRRIARLAGVLLTLSCVDQSPPDNHSTTPETDQEKPRINISQLAPIGPSVQHPKHRITAGGDPTESPQKTPVSEASQGDVELAPATWDPSAFIRPRRRMNIDQLDQSIRQATGGIGWDDSNNNYVSMWIGLQPTLGVPDFYQRVVEDLTPNLVFQKFLSDAAQVVCTNLMTQEQQVPADQRVFLVAIGPNENPNANPQKTDLNLKHLLLRYHGKSFATDSPAMVPWRWLVNSVAAKTNTIDAWQATCVALITHPEFYSY